MFTRSSVFCLLSIFVKVVRSQEQSLPASNQVCLIVPPEVEECYRGFQGKPIEDKAAQVNCLQKLLWNFTPDTNNTQREMEYFRSLVGDIGAFTASSVLRKGNPRPPSGRRARQEYRTLTPTERQRFHDALNKLYEDGSMRAFARLHARAFPAHHGGPSVLPWNRVFLVVFEEALRQVDPTVSLPFWDSTIDFDMDNPVNSVLWTAEYFGNGIGDVTSGPAANWVTDQGNLERNYGQASRLFSKDQIRRILSRCEHQQISQPTAETVYDLELHLGGPHIWVGGDMAFPATAAFDPVFYMHRAFVDYVWELFRRRQYRLCNIDPTTDYPNVPAGNSHAPESSMVGFEWLTNTDGMKHYWIDNWYYYESTPACPNCCRGCRFPAPIYCDRRRRVCAARSRRNFAFGPRGPGISQASAFSQASLDPAEIEAINAPVPPRNRGVLFQHPPSDGRTIHTAISDALAFTLKEEQAAREPPGQVGQSGSDTRSSGARDQRGNGRSRSSETNGRLRSPETNGRLRSPETNGRSSSPDVSSRRSLLPESWGTSQTDRGSSASSSERGFARIDDASLFRNGGRGPPPPEMPPSAVEGMRGDLSAEARSRTFSESIRRDLPPDVTGRSFPAAAGRGAVLPDPGRSGLRNGDRGGFPSGLGRDIPVDSVREFLPVETGRGLPLDGRAAMPTNGGLRRDTILEPRPAGFGTGIAPSVVVDGRSTEFIADTGAAVLPGDRRPSGGGRQVLNPETLPVERPVSTDPRLSLPELGAFSERGRSATLDMTGVKISKPRPRTRRRRFDTSL